jgi:hypothetical protein
MMTLKTKHGLLQVTPAAGVSFKDLKAHIRGAHRCEDDGCFACARFPTGGSTARWIKPLGDRAVMCPTCLAPVNLTDWWAHGCRQVAKPQDRRHPMTEWRHTRTKAVKARKIWTGDKPTTCNYCNAPIRNGFADSPMPGRSSWGIMCGLCWNLHGREPGVWYEKRGREFIKIEGE